MSGRLVAAMILTFASGSNPSISASSCIRVRWTSRSPLVATSSRFAPIESTSSMKMMVGAFSRANWNSSRTRRAPSPMYFWTSSLPTRRTNVAFVWCATAFAIIVLPVPGEPDQQDPLRGIDADLLVQLRPQERELDRLADVPDLVPEATDVLVSHGRLVDDLARRDERVERRGQDAHHRQGLLVERDASSRR